MTHDEMIVRKTELEELRANPYEGSSSHNIFEARRRSLMASERTEKMQRELDEINRKLDKNYIS